MRIEWAISLRYFRSPRAEGAISLITWIAVAGVTLGVSALVVAMAVMSGYQVNLVRAMGASLPHVSLYPVERTGFRQQDQLLRALQEGLELESISPFAMVESLVQPLAGPAGKVRGVMLRGIDPQLERRTEDFLALLDDGSPGWAGLPLPERLRRAEALLARLAEPVGDALPVILSRILAEKLGVARGGRLVPLEFPKAGAGFSPIARSARLEVIGYFESGIVAFDELVLLMNLAHLAQIGGLGTGEQGLGLRLRDPLEAGAVVRMLRRRAPIGVDDYRVYSWLDSNRGLFQVIRVQKAMLFLVLMLIVVLAFFGMISALMMLVTEKLREIAILKSLGAGDRTIRRVFILQGLVIGVVGTALGVALGLGVCWVLDTFPVIEIPPGVYPGSNKVPVLVSPGDVLMVVGGTMAVCLAAAVYPAQKAMAMAPAEGLRYE